MVHELPVREWIILGGNEDREECGDPKLSACFKGDILSRGV